ncbi:BLUF domain-containing protein [Stenotrophomonas sp. S48]|uniref:BLUF domain-containing protein n=1 Tax=unclassified Stenotrophomonas TaxID=196198 RepID=UPI0019011BAD|nr:MULTISPECIES: BLUF domain-containing protein [unclassified Stenotrophomonas]MBK0026258.1 BLUF domain-containing protein [Stenotrophomonas sp. S48]MBK0049056.1 BLUF domain-containing protein [Stenotrophomonas sp. S49]
MPLRAIAYASEAVPGLSIDDVDDLTRAAARFNLEAGVTGVLLHDGSRFLQYIEGPDDSINVVYDRIISARSHHELVELGRAHISARFFPYWSMRWLPAQPTDIRIISRGDWSGLNRSGGVHRLSLLVSQHLSSPPAA